MVRAKMAVWLLEEPWRVMKPRSFVLSSCTVSLGVRSSATRMAGWSAIMSASPTPRRTLTTRREMSFTSAARARMYSSSMAAKAAAKFSPVADAAYSAVAPWVSRMPRTASR